MDSWWDFCGTFWKGPGWCPGGGRLGDASQVAEVPVRAKHEVVLYCTVLYCTVLYCTVQVAVSGLLHAYTLPHFALAFLLAITVDTQVKVREN